jgi:hypothetical protein
MLWGPYRNQPEARACLCAFSDEVFKQHIGVIWSADDDAQWLRSPIFDSEGYGLTLLARFDGIKPPPPPPPPSFVDRMDKFLGAPSRRLDSSRSNRAVFRLQQRRP